MKLLSIISLILMVFGSTSLGQIPDSAHINGITNEGWVGGICYLASLGQILQLEDPNIQPMDVVVRSTMAVQASWGKVGNTYMLGIHPDMYHQGPMTDTARLFNFTYHVYYLDGGGGGAGWVDNADDVTEFQTEQEAIDTLKQLIAGGTPIQVHVDMYYMQQEAAVYNPLWGGELAHSSHFFVVHGYDEDYIYYTDNGPTNSELTGENIPISWESFLDAWYFAGELTTDQTIRTGPYYLTHLTSPPNLIDDDWTLIWAAQSAWEAPNAIWDCSDSIYTGTNPSVAFDQFTLDRFPDMRTFMANFLDAAGYSEIADLYESAASNWDTLKNNYTTMSESTIVSTLDTIADQEAQALHLILDTLEENADAFYLFEPAADTILADLDDTSFQWLCLPLGTSKYMLQLAMTGDFDDTANLINIKIKSPQTSQIMTDKLWLKALKKEDGDRHLAWRIAGLGSDADQTSEERGLYWQIQQFTSLTPADDYELSEGELLTFTFTVPGIATKPIVMLSTTGDFSNNKSCLKLKVAKGASQAVFKSNTIAALRKKDDGDNIIYWRVQDLQSAKTTVQPSETRTLILP